MRNFVPKIIILIGISLLFVGCSVVKKVPDGKYLLDNNELIVNGKKESSDKLTGLLYQQPNGKVLGTKLRLQLYNMAKDQPDSLYRKWLDENPKKRDRLTSLISAKQTDRMANSFLISGFSNILKSLGEAPVILNEERTERSVTRLKNYYHNNGYFNATVESSTDTTEYKKATVRYEINTQRPFFIDSISYKVQSPELLKLYERTQKYSLIKSGEQYNAATLDDERDRIAGFFRNNGAYDFQKNYINYEIDSLKQNNKADLMVLIENQSIRTSDTIATQPFRLYTINKVSYHITQNPTNRNNLSDSTYYQGVHIYSDGPLRFKPKTIVNANFIQPNAKFSDFSRNMTSRSFAALQSFSYPGIEFIKTPGDTTGTLLDARILLIPLKKGQLNPALNATHSNIQQVGLEGSLGFTFRNVFRGAENLNLSVHGNIGSSASRYRGGRNTFFDILEYGADARLSFPRFLFFGGTDKILPRRMFPTTHISLGYSSQRNIGLDKQNLTSVFNYSWTPSRQNGFSFDVLNLQYVQNLNPDNYFNVYRSSYNRLNEIAEGSSAAPEYFDENGNLNISDGGTDHFIDDVLAGEIPLNNNDYNAVRSISERKDRLSENNLILASSLTFTRSTRYNLDDQDFYTLRAKLESAGNFMNLIAKKEREDGTETFLDIAYSQYVKAELDFVKYFKINNKQVFAFRAFGGIAIPYGNSNSIPFSRSYFAGGTNDNRAWQSYNLGPGRSGGVNDFNEANLKLALSTEYRFNVAGPWNLALFVDAGNIWNVLDNVDDPEMTFNGFSSLQDLAVGSGIGLRYDLSFFIIRLDVGFKTYNPAKDPGEKWFRELNLSKAVFNIGINHPF
ncbi:translocation and assembly module lipoprotein TamL [Avrilella dinanensis]|uniref:translocation and assembly module lipoprotein TamL n=1 Tax=Avrilella dinanensis TaxID=2008672 RepID=UPI001FAFEA9C|nr:BamA/TamA family outer membrane protein [Avrilella dinanensis]